MDEAAETAILKNYLLGKGLPDSISAKAKKRIKRKSVKFDVCELRGEPCLVYVGAGNTEGESEIDGADSLRELREVVADKEERRRILYRLHDENGHIGRNRSRTIIQKQYYWPGMIFDIDEYVHSCEYCQGPDGRERKLKQKTPVRSLAKTKHPIPKSESVMTCHALRLRPGDELKGKLLEYVKEHNLRAAFILTCVGSLRKASIRLADSVSVINLDKNHEIVSLTGTLSGGHGHLHISLSDEEGKVIGGHLMGDAEVFTTAEVVIGELHQLEFCREPDQETGYSELKVKNR